MVTAIYKGRKRRLYLVEWRDELGVSAEKMAERLEVTRQTVHRWEREHHRLNPEKIAAYAHALQKEPEDMWRHPGRPSADGLLADLDDKKVQGAVEMLEVWLKTASGR